MIWFIAYLLVGLTIGCIRQIFRKGSVRSKFQKAFLEELEELAKKNETSKWEGAGRKVFSANPNASLWTRAVIESKEDVEKTGETFWVLALTMGHMVLWGPTLALDVFSKIKRLFN
ncbi:MAG TPA: hypothetical protein VI978_00135 [Candidatus Paceibacterota bacterium]